MNAPQPTQSSVQTASSASDSLTGWTTAVQLSFWIHSIQRTVAVSRPGTEVLPTLLDFAVLRQAPLVGGSEWAINPPLGKYHVKWSGRRPSVPFVASPKSRDPPPRRNLAWVLQEVRATKSGCCCHLRRDTTCGLRREIAENVSDGLRFVGQTNFPHLASPNTHFSMEPDTLGPCLHTYCQSTHSFES